MNRIERLATASQGRTSLTLLRKQLEKANEEAANLRSLLFGYTKQVGRLRVDRAIVDGLTEDDRIDVRVEGDVIVLDYANCKESA